MYGTRRQAGQASGAAHTDGLLTLALPVINVDGLVALAKLIQKPARSLAYLLRATSCMLIWDHLGQPRAVQAAQAETAARLQA